VPVPAEVAGLAAAPLVTGQGSVVRRGGGVIAIGAGPVVLTQLLRGAADLDLTVVNLPWLNRVDHEWLAGLAAAADEIVVVDNHYTHGGQADLVARALLEIGSPPRFHGIGLTQVPVCGTDDEALDAHHLSAARLVRRIRDRVPAMKGNS
jgi:transketolase